MQSFFKTLKLALVYPQRYATPAQARLDIGNWMEGCYKAERLHSPNATRRQSLQNRARWTRSLVYVESMQGNFDWAKMVGPLRQVMCAT